MTIPILATPDLSLRPWVLTDVDRLYEILQEKDIFKYFPSTGAPPRAWAEKYINHHLSHWRARGFGHWAVITRADGLIVGWAGLEYLPELDQVEVAYLLSNQAWGRGYATQAARLALAYGFETCALAEIIGLVHPGNAASIRVLEKCGMTLSDTVTLWGMELLRYAAGRQVQDRAGI